MIEAILYEQKNEDTVDDWINGLIKNSWTVFHLQQVSEEIWRVLWSKCDHNKDEDSATSK